MTTSKTVLLLCVAALLGVLAACDAPERLRSDAELGLNPVQASGHHLFDRHCATCHAAYSSRTYKGPSLQGIFKKPYLKTGAPANDDRVREVIALGYNKMPSYSRALTPQQIDELLAYLHTL